VGGGEAVGDGILVTADAAGEGVQGRVVAGLDVDEPAVKVLGSGPVRHHLGEVGYIPG
jgi:hypothetical protein